MVNLKLNFFDNAVSFIHQAILLHRESKSDEKNDGALAAYYSNAALIYSLANHHEMAIQWVLHAIEYRGKLNLKNDKELLGHYLIASDVYFRAGDKEKADQLRNLAKKFKEGFEKEK